MIAALRDVMHAVSDVRSMLVYAPGCVVSTQCVSTLLRHLLGGDNQTRKQKAVVRSVEIDALQVCFDGGLEKVLTSAASGMHFDRVNFDRMLPRVMTNYERLRYIRTCIVFDEQGIAFNRLLRGGGRALRSLEVLDLRWCCSMSVFDDTTFTNLRRLADLHVRFDFFSDEYYCDRRRSVGREVVVEVPAHLATADVHIRCCATAGVSVVVKQGRAGQGMTDEQRGP